MKCCVCSTDRDEVSCVILMLSDEEKATIRAMGQKPETSYAYCRPCFQILSNPEQGAQLIRGAFRHSLQAEGVQNAESLASRYYKFLISKTHRT